MQTVASLLRLGVEHHQAGRRADAEKLYRQVLDLHPNHPDALNLLGILAHESGQYQQAVELIRAAILAGPKMASYHANLALPLLALNQPEEAANSYRAALSLNPSDADSHYRLGNILLAMGKPDEATQSFSQSIRLRPNFPGVYNDLGNALKQLGMLTEAAEAYRQCIRLAPNSAETWSNLGDTLRELRQLPQSLQAAQNAIQLKPNFPEGLCNLGNTLKDLGQMPQAMDVYERAVRLNPSSPAIRTNYLYAMHFHIDDPSKIMEAHREFDRVHCAPLARTTPNSNDRSLNRPLKIAYISADFRSHSIGRMLQPLFSQHDHQQFHITCYSDTRTNDHLTDWLKSRSDSWLQTQNLSDVQLAARIESDQIDILIDLTQHMAGNRLLVFARQPAPVQISYGYPATTGLSAMTYRLTDTHLDPPGQTEPFNSERLLRIDPSFWCHWYEETDPPVAPLPATTNSFITFGSLNNPCKHSLAALDLWTRVLNAVPNSKLMLLTFEPPGQDNYFTRQFSARNIDPNRIRLVTPRPRREYLELYNLIDIGLDPIPYNGHMTSCDSFWMGVPVITLPGKTSVGRGGISLLQNLKLPELIAKNPESFISIASDLAHNQSRLTELRATLRNRMKSSPLCDTKAFTQAVEKAYRHAWQQWCQK